MAAIGGSQAAAQAVLHLQQQLKQAEGKYQELQVCTQRPLKRSQTGLASLGPQSAGGEEAAAPGRVSAGRGAA